MDICLQAQSLCEKYEEVNTTNSGAPTLERQSLSDPYLCGVPLASII